MNKQTIHQHDGADPLVVGRQLKVKGRMPCSQRVGRRRYIGRKKKKYGHRRREADLQSSATHPASSSLPSAQAPVQSSSSTSPSAQPPPSQSPPSLLSPSSLLLSSSSPLSPQKEPVQSSQSHPSSHPPPTVSSPPPAVSSPPPSIPQEPSSPCEAMNKSKKKRKRDYDDDERKREAVSLFYQVAFHSKNDTTEDLQGEVSDEIYKAFSGQVRKDVIQRVVVETNNKLRERVQYCAQRKQPDRTDKKKIQQGCGSEHYVTYLKERASYTQVTDLYNVLCAAPEGRDIVGRKAVYNAIQRTTHKIKKTEVVSQANNKNEFWKLARLYYCSQLLVRLGEALPDDLHMDELAHGSVAGTEAYTYEKLAREGLTIDSIYRIAFWDEMHVKQKAGELRDHYIIFPRNEHGVYDAENGTYDKDDDENARKRKKFKFTDEGRYCLGFAAVKGEDGEMKGVRLDMFDYTGTNIIGFKKERQLIKQEIDRVKQLPDTNKKWWYDPRAGDQRVWEEDPVTKLHGVGGKTASKLADAGIERVKHLKQINKEAIQDIQNKSGLSMKRLTTLKDAALKAETGHCPLQLIDFRKADNPYESKYGENWKVEIYKSGELRGCTHITTVIKHIDEATRKVFRGTEYEDTYLWCHDSLEAFANRETVEWMERNGFLKRWVRPVLGVNGEITATDKNGKQVSRSNYADRPPGNSPELMPNDNSLFRDLKAALDMHCVFTLKLQNSDPRKFSKATPNEITRAIRRIFDPVSGVAPRPERILQDIDRVPLAIRKIVEHRGAIVPGLCDRNGHRRAKVGRGQLMDLVEIEPDKLQRFGFHNDVVELSRDMIREEKLKVRAFEGSKI